MRRIAAILTAAVLTLLGATPATAAPAAPTAPAPLGGNSTLTSGTGYCKAAFAARQGGIGRLIAGPGCALPLGTPMYSGGVLVGPVSAVATSGVTVVTVTNTAAWQLVPWIPAGGVRHVIRGSVATPIGGPVCLLGGSTGVQCGVVTAKNQTVNFPGGVISGLSRTNICFTPGSAAFVSGNQAQGVPLGGSGGCSTTGVSFFQPVNQLLAAYGLTLVTG